MTLVARQAVVAPDIRTRLVDAAEQAMRAVGPLALRIDDVAQRAGCSRATVYRYVRDKDELVREVLVKQAHALADRLERELDSLGDPADAIAEGVLRTVDAVRREWWYRATEWLVVVTIGLLTMDVPVRRDRAGQARFLKQFVAYSLLTPRR